MDVIEHNINHLLNRYRFFQLRIQPLQYLMNQITWFHDLYTFISTPVRESLTYLLALYSLSSYYLIMFEVGSHAYQGYSMW